MGSSVRNAFEAANALVMQKINEKEEKAFKNTMKRMEDELFEIMKKATVRNFYGGWIPRVYKRTGQLKNAISIKLDDASTANTFSFDIIPIYDETKMDHSELTLIYQPMKNKRPFCNPKTYTYVLEDVDEKKIMDMTLGAGYHPKVGTALTEAPIWLDDDNDTGILFDQLEDYVRKNASRIYNEE
jgi:hypothetical protein